MNKNQYEAHVGGYWHGSYVNNLASWSDADCLAELTAIKSWGCNTVRFIQAADFWISDTNNHRQLIKNLLVDAASKSIYVIYCGYMVNDWSNGGVQDPLPYPPYQLSPGAAGIIANEAAFVSYWSSIASELKGYPNVIFELWNEPGGDAAAEATWVTACQDCINAIRAAGATNLIVIQWGTGIWGNVTPLSPAAGSDLSWIASWGLTDPLGNIVYSTHNYYNDFVVGNGAGGIGDYYAYTYAEMDEGFNTCGLYSAAASYPILIGEEGCDIAFTGADLAKEYTRYQNVLGLFDSYDLGFLGWWWSNAGVCGLLSAGAPAYTPNQAGLYFKSYL